MELPNGAGSWALAYHRALQALHHLYELFRFTFCVPERPYLQVRKIKLFVFQVTHMLYSTNDLMGLLSDRLRGKLADCGLQCVLSMAGVVLCLDIIYREREKERERER